MNKLLVTGASGFVGRCLVPFLQERGYKVKALIRDKDKVHLFSKQTEIAIGDLTDPYSLQKACANVDTIFHLAGLAHDNKSKSYKHLNINFYGTHRLIQAAVSAKVQKFIYLSSVKAEDSTTPYGISKRKAEELLLHEAKSHSFHAVILRPSLIYGPGCKGNLANMLKAIDKGYFIPIPQTYNRRSMISINDVCATALLVANSSKANGKIYTLSDGKEYSTRDIYEEMCKALGKAVPKWYIPYGCFKLLANCGDIITKLLHLPMPFNSHMLDKLLGSSHYDAKKLREDFNFQSEIEINQLLPAMVSSYKGNST